MALHPNVVSISDMMLRLRGNPVMERADASMLRRASWAIGKPATYANCSTKMANGNRLEATVTSKGAFWIDVHNDGPTYCIAKGEDAGCSIVGAAIICAEMMDPLRAGEPVPVTLARHMLATEAA